MIKEVSSRYALKLETTRRTGGELLPEAGAVAG